MHQWFIQWQGDNVEVVQADTSVSVATADLAYWEFDDFECFSGRIWKGGIVKISDERQQLIQAIGSESLFWWLLQLVIMERLNFAQMNFFVRI